jgi:YgiT-type zinc finger domain-containing protein
MKRKKRSADVECALCGQRAARIVPTPKVFGRGARRALIENIPVYHCRNCHGQYIDGSTMDAIDEIRKNPSVGTRKETIAIAALAA